MVSSPQRLNMYKKTIKGVDYHIYENEDEFRKHHRKEEVKEDWSPQKISIPLKSTMKVSLLPKESDCLQR